MMGMGGREPTAPPSPTPGLFSVLPPFSPFLRQETPSGFQQKPDLSSLVCMLHWDVPSSLSCSLYSSFIPRHKYCLPHVFVCLFLPLFFSPISQSRSLLLSLSLSSFSPRHCVPAPQTPPTTHRGPRLTIRGPVM